MIRLRKYYRRYALVFLIALACIFGQAQSELALPDYMSNIVSNGIQAGGFENAVSPVLSVSTYQHVISFSNKKNKKIIQNSYRFTKAKNVPSSIKKTFPKAKDLYILKDSADEDKLNSAMLKSMLIVNSISSMDTKSSEYKKISKNLSKGVNSAVKSYNKGLEAYNKGYQQYQKGLKQYQSGKASYEKGLKAYNTQYSKYLSGVSEYNKGKAQIEKAKAQYNKGLAQYNKGYKQYTTGLKQYQKGYKQYQNGLSQYNKGLKAYNSLKSAYPQVKALNDQATTLQKQIEATSDETQKAILQKQLDAINKNLNTKTAQQVLKQGAQLSNMNSQLKSSKKQLDAAKTKLVKAKKQLSSAKAKLSSAKKKLDQAKTQIAAGEAKLATAKKQLDSAKAQFASAKAKLDQAKASLPKAKKQLEAADKKLKKAKKKLDEGKSKINEMQTALKNGNLYYFLDQMSTAQKNKMFKSIDKQMKSMGESTMNIAGGQAVKAEYKRLGADTDKVQNDYIRLAGLKMLAVALLGAIVTIAAALFASRIGAGVARDLRLALFKKVESFSNEEMDRFSTASLITRSTNDITQIQNVTVMFIRMVCYAPILGIGALIHALESSVSMTWIIGLVIIVIIVVLGVTFAIATPKFKIIQTLIDKLNLAMRENLSGILVIRAFGNEKESEHRFDLANTDLTKVNLFVNRVMSSLIPIMMFIMNSVSLLIVYVGSHQIDLGNIQIGEMLAFMQYGMMIIMGFLMIAMIAIMLPRASVSANRIADVIDTTPSITSAENALPFDHYRQGLIEFNDVTFNYPSSSEPALEHITFTAEPGKTTAFIGSTGSGKSTLINLIPRFYDVTQGSVKVDGINVKEADVHELRNKIGLVPQKGQLFSGTIRSNLTYGAPDISDDDLEKVIEVSQAKEFIDKMPERLNSPVSQGGTNVSGGQRQRLAIARALAKNPEILIFDDSFSALDFKTDAALRKELNKMIKKTNNTVLIVGQRIASIMNADQIIVLDEGKIVGRGTHDELMRSCKVYQEIAYSQLSKEELENEQR